MKNTQRSIVALRWLGLIATILLLFSAITPLWNIAGGLLAVDPVLKKADAIVVLGNGIDPDGALTAESMRRFMHGVRLYKQAMAPLLVVTGPPRTDKPYRSEADARKEIAVELGIAGNSVITISTVTTTREEAMQVAAVLAERHATTVLLVTDPMHMRRARDVFEHAGLKTFPAPSDNIFHAANSPQDRLILMWHVIEQSAGLLYYRVAGYI